MGVRSAPHGPAADEVDDHAGLRAERPERVLRGLRFCPAGGPAAEHDALVPKLGDAVQLRHRRVEPDRWDQSVGDEPVLVSGLRPVQDAIVIGLNAGDVQLGVVDAAHVEPIGREDGRDLDPVDAHVVQAFLSVVHPFPNAVVAVSMVPDVGWAVSGRHLEAERTEPGAILVRPAFVPVGAS